MERKSIYLIGLICILSLSLCGCSVVRNIVTDNKNPQVVETPHVPTPQTTPTPTTSEAPVPTTYPVPEISSTSDPSKQKLPATVDVVSKEPEYVKVLESIIDYAPPMSILAVLSDSQSENFKAFGEPAKKMDLSTEFIGWDTDRIIFTPLQDDVHIKVEATDYRFKLSYSWLDTRKVLYEFDAKMGEHYELAVHLAEGIPSARVSAQWGGRTLSWNCSYDGVGNRDIEYLSFSELEEDRFENALPYAETISGAAALSYALFGEDEFWESVLYAATLMEDEGDGKPIILSEERFYQYVETIHPGFTAWPEYSGYISSIISYSERDKAFMFEPYDNDPIGTWELGYVDAEMYGNGGSVWIETLCPNMDEFPVTYEVVWARNKNRGDNNPFAFSIVEIIRHEAVG